MATRPVARYGNFFEAGSAEHYGNNVAAMPSLHAAYALLVVLFLWRLSPWWVRPLLALYPPAMAFSLVYGGEHYIVDCVAGWAYAAFAYFSVEYVFAWRAPAASTSSPRWSIERDRARSISATSRSTASGGR